MKNLKLSLVGLFSLAGLAATAADCHAWGWCRDRLCYHSTYICCKPYNAFTPVCFGSITCNGCAPVMMQPPSVPNYGGWGPTHGACGPMGCNPAYTVGDGCGPGLPGGLPHGGHYGPQANMPMPQGYAPQHYAGMPMPHGYAPQPHGAMPQGYAPQPHGAMPVPIQQQSHMVPQQPNMQPAGFQGGYQVPGYYVQPVSYFPMWPNQPVVPNYWYGR